METRKISNDELTKEFWINKNKDFNNLFKCSKCFYKTNSFLPFIKKNENVNLKVLETTQKDSDDDMNENKNYFDNQ